MRNDPPPTPLKSDSQFDAQRQTMIEAHLKGRDITSAFVLTAMKAVKRHLFIPHAQPGDAYGDFPLPIGHGQTISQPYIVALMTQLGIGKRTTRPQRVLDIGTGSGYQAAVLAELAEHVYSVEIICDLADSAREKLTSLQYKNITVRCGDGYQGWKEHAPFDLIIVAAAAPNHVPQPLKDQLAPGGTLVIPVGDPYQQLLTITRTEEGTLNTKSVLPVRFVPMTGQAQEKQEP